MRASELKNGEIKAGFYYLTGEDAFWREIAVKAFRSINGEDSLSLTVIDKLNDISDALYPFNSINFFGEPNTVIVRDGDFKLDDKGHADLLSFLKKGDSGNFLVFSNGAMLNAAEKKLMTTVDCAKPDKYSATVMSEKLFGGMIERNALDRLVEYTDADLARIVLEKEKLIAYCGERKITRQDIEAVVPKDVEWQVYEFSNNIVSGKNSIALEQIAKLKRSKEEPAGLLALLTSQFRRMLYAAISPLSDDELSVLWKIKPYAVQKARESGWGKVKLRKAVVMLSDYEHKFKSGKMSDTAAFNNAVLRLMGDAI